MDQNEQRDLLTLKGWDGNPRTITGQQMDALKQSMATFGDLSGIIRNVKTDRLVGGHQRVEAFRTASSAKVVITEKLPEQNAVGTVAYGYVEIAGLEGERFNYREVAWEEDFEAAANVAANNIGGEFNEGQLAELISKMDSNLAKLTGSTQAQIDRLKGLTGAAGDTPDGQKETPIFEVIVECNDELQQGELFNELRARGLAVSMRQAKHK